MGRSGTLRQIDENKDLEHVRLRQSRSSTLRKSLIQIITARCRFPDSASTRVTRRKVGVISLMIC
jgi:hypothetical protein